MSNLGGEGSPLLEEFENKIRDQVAFINQSFEDDTESLGRGKPVNLENLTACFP